MGGPRSATIEKAFWLRAQQRRGCWGWETKPNAMGYSVLGFQGQQLYAHRVSWEILNGPIPLGYDVDHICHNRDRSCLGGTSCPHRACVNPEHLRVVPRRENAHAGRNGPRKICTRGHRMTDDNSYWRPDEKGRMCRECARIRDQKRPARSYDPTQRRLTYLRKKEREVAGEK